MAANNCPFCEQVNPADAKFCNACGGALHLAPCARCGAVNDITASTCYQCHVQLPGRGTDARDPAQPTAEVSKRLPGAPSRVIVGAAVLAAIALLGYYGYRQTSLVDAPQPPAASGEASGRGGSAGTGVIGRDAAGGDTTPAKVDEVAQPASPATAPPETPPADPAPAAAIPPRAAKAGGRAQARQELCTEAAAALGLCTMTPDQKKQAEAAAANKAAGGQEPPRQEACTEAVAALGLCAPGPTQRRE